MLAQLAIAAALTISPAGANAHTFDNARKKGGVVGVLPGRYPKQILTEGGRPTIFYVRRGTVVVNGLNIEGATYVELRDMTIRGWNIDSGDHITFRRVTTVGAFYINAPASQISIIGGSVGPSHNFNSTIAVPGDDIDQPSHGILIDGVRFHDVSRGPGVDAECLMLAQGDGVVIRNSFFTGCAVFDLFVTWWYFRPKVGPPVHVTITGNHFARTTDGGYSVLFADYAKRYPGVTMRGNFCGQGFHLLPGVVSSGNHGC
jgi:hypothetical protein